MDTVQRQKKIIVIGGGAAGMYCGILLSRAGHQVTILEKNEKLGKKLFITGKGRCNFTNDCDRDTFFSSVVTNPKFLYSAYASCTPQDMIRFFEDAGLPTKVERGHRAFPASDHAYDVIDTLKRQLNAYGAKVILHAEVTELIFEKDASSFPCVTGVRYTRTEHAPASAASDAVIIATGGLSYPATGSTGDGYRLAAGAGHHVTGCRPSLVPMILKEKDICMSLAGLAPKNVTLTITKDDAVVFREFGEMLFTHEGLSGPLVLSASAIVRDLCPVEEMPSDRSFTAWIDWKSNVSAEEFDTRLVKLLSSAPQKEIHNLLHEVYPTSLIPVLLTMADIAPDKKASVLTRAERLRIVQYTKNMPFTILGTAGYREAVITCGGIDVSEIDPKTMASKKASGLYCIGEVLDLDALTGGFNLQIAWMTAHACATHLSEE